MLYLSRLSDRFVRQTALESAGPRPPCSTKTGGFIAERVDGLNPKKTKVRFSENYAKDDTAMPLPATYAIDIADRISRNDPNVQARIYSDHPWPGRQDGGPHDDFERRRWSGSNRTTAGPTSFPGVQRDHEKEGERWLWYARPRLMEKSCLACHNDPKGKSPKKDWQVGDVGGVIKIGRRLESPTGPRTGTMRALALMIASGVMLAAFVAVTFRRVRPAGSR